MAMQGEINSLVNRIEALERELRRALADIASLERKLQDLVDVVQRNQRRN